MDCSAVLVCADVHTARFVCTTDDDMRQIASFYTGAMAALPRDRAGPARRPGRRARPGAGRRQRPRRDAAPHRRVPRAGHPVRGRPVPAARPHGRRRRSARLVEGARYLLTNDYEWELLLQKTGWTEAQVAERVGDPDHHARRERRARSSRRRDDAEGRRRARDRQGRPHRRRRRVPRRVPRRPWRAASLERAAQLGSLIAVQVLETDGAQEWTWDRARPGAPARRLRPGRGRRDRARGGAAGLNPGPALS